MNPATVEGHGTQLKVVHGSDDSLYVNFYYNKVAEKDYIKIRVPGDHNTQWDEPVQDKHRERFAQQWDAYQRKVSQHGSNTLIEDADFLNAHQKEMLTKKYGVETVKQLAEMADGFISNIMGGREMQGKALNYLRSEQENINAKKFEEENRHLKNQITTQQVQMEAMQKQLDDMMKQMDEVTKPKKAKNESTANSSTSGQ